MSAVAILTSNVELTGLLLGTFSATLGLISFIGLICIVVEEAANFKERQRREKEKSNSSQKPV